MGTATATRELVVWAEKRVLPEAAHVFSQLGTPMRAVPMESSKKIPKSRVFIVYLHGSEPKSELRSAIKLLKSSRKTPELLLFYTPHHPPTLNFAFEVGLLLGREIGEKADWAFDLRGVKQLLRARNLLVHGAAPEASAAPFDIAAARKRLGLTQEQMASAVNVTPRTLQNWEKKIGTSQLPRKTRDLRELLDLIDDYVVSSEEQNWLKSPLKLLQNRRPIDLIAEGKLRDLIVQFQRMREGQPL